MVFPTRTLAIFVFFCCCRFIFFLQSHQFSIMQTFLSLVFLVFLLVPKLQQLAKWYVKMTVDEIDDVSFASQSSWSWWWWACWWGWWWRGWGWWCGFGFGCGWAMYLDKLTHCCRILKLAKALIYVLAMLRATLTNFFISHDFPNASTIYSSIYGASSVSDSCDFN